MPSRLSLIFAFFLGFHFQSSAQSTLDTAKRVDIISAETMYLKPELNQQILAGNVVLRQGTTLSSCDSCVINGSMNTFEAFGRVYINDNDSTKVWSDYLRYLTDKRYAYLSGNVKEPCI